MARGGALAVKVEPVIYEFPVRYQHDRTGWMAWPEGLPVSAIAPTKVGARQKLRAAVRAYFRSAARHGDSLPAPPHRIPAAADTIDRNRAIVSGAIQMVGGSSSRRTGTRN